MINILEQPQPILNPRYKPVATFNTDSHKANVIATLLARDPYLSLGRILAYNHMSKPAASTTTKGPRTGYEDDPRLKAVLTPGFMRVLSNFSVASTIESLLNMTMTETHHVNQLSRQISASIVDGGVTTLGLNLRNLVTMEGPLARPVPLSRLLKQDCALSFLNQHLTSLARTDLFRFGAEPDIECTPTFEAIGAGPVAMRSTKQMLAAFLDSLSTPPSNEALTVKPSSKGGYSLSVNDAFASHSEVMSAILDFMLAFKTDGPMLSQLDTVSNLIPVDHLRDYMTPQLMKVHQDNSASALIVTYYCMAPLMLRLKYMKDTLDHPVFQLMLSEQKIDIMSHPRIKSALEFIDKFSLPTLLASEYNQSRSVSFTFGTQEISDPMVVEASSANEFIYGPTTLADQLRDTSATSLFSLLIRLDTLLDADYMKRDRILAVASAMAGPSFGSSGKIILRPLSSSQLNVTDSHRATQPASSLFGTTRQINVSLAVDNKADPNLREIPTENITTALVGPKAAPFQQVGFTEATNHCVFVRKAYIHEQLLQRATSSGAHQLAPFPAAGMPGPDDVIIRIDGPDELADQLGFFGRADMLADLPFAMRFDTSKPFYVVKGPISAKFVFSSLLVLVPAHSHWRLSAVDALVGSSLNLSQDDIARLVCVPAPDKAVLRLSSAKTVAFDSEIAGVFGARVD